MQFFMNFILIIEFSLNLKFQIDLLSFSFEKSENMNCNVQKTLIVDEHFDPLAHENGIPAAKLYIPEDRASDTLQNLLDHNSFKFGSGFLLGDKVCMVANFLWSY